MTSTQSSAQKRLFQPASLLGGEIKNRIFMAPLTRSRADDATDVPSDMFVEYYSQRASAGVIVTEATQISPMGKGYIGTPGIYTEDQAAAWRKVTDAVHEKGGKIVVQLWHVGRISHPDLLPGNALPVGPSAIKAQSTAFTADGPKDTPTPHALTQDEIKQTIADYAHATKIAKLAGFDGVEIHAANGYLIDQFLRNSTNKREDDYGGSLENRVRFLSEVTDAVIDAWSADRVGVRLSPFGTFNDIQDDNPEEIFSAAIKVLNNKKVAYLHMVEEFPFADITLAESEALNQKQIDALTRMRGLWDQLYVANGGFDGPRALDWTENGRADAVSFGRPYISNPDLVERVLNNWPFADADANTFYGGDETGYTDYPRYSE